MHILGLPMMCYIDFACCTMSTITPGRATQWGIKAQIYGRRMSDTMHVLKLHATWKNCVFLVWFNNLQCVACGLIFDISRF